MYFKNAQKLQKNQFLIYISYSWGLLYLCQLLTCWTAQPCKGQQLHDICNKDSRRRPSEFIDMRWQPMLGNIYSPACRKTDDILHKGSRSTPYTCVCACMADLTPWHSCWPPAIWTQAKWQLSHNDPLIPICCNNAHVEGLSVLDQGQKS